MTSRSECLGPEEILTCTILGQPLGKGRPRMTRSGHAYTPASTRNFEALIRHELALAMGGKTPVSDAALGLFVAMRFQVPGSWPKWRKEMAEHDDVWHMGRPDADNVLKAIEDAGNNVVWVDDAQIADVRVSKRYSHRPRIEVSVYRLRGPTAKSKRRAYDA